MISVQSSCRVVFISVLALASLARGVSDEELDKAINAGKQYLYSKQSPDKTWETTETHDDLKPTGKQHGGLTAIATFGLLAAGENASSPQLKPAIDFLKKNPAASVYVLGVRLQIWSLLPEADDIRRLIEQDKKAILSQLKAKPPAKGLFYYPNTAGQANYDHSISQFGVLGLWMADRHGAEVGTQVWATMESAWRNHQMPDGGWTYIHPKDGGNPGSGEHDTNPSMTTAGVASLFITQEYTHNPGGECRGNIVDPNIDKGLAFLAAHFQDIVQPPNPRMNGLKEYALFGIERVGRASGLKYFGTIDWFEEGARYLSRAQAPDGSWGQGGDFWGINSQKIPTTALSLVFLARGRAPIIINKLNYDIINSNQKPENGRWNQRPRDIANFTNWMSEQSERTLSWQIVNLNAPADWHSAPILYISGDQALTFTPEQETKLAEFCEDGGLIVASADCGSEKFTESLRKLGKKILPQYEFTPVTEDHKLYTEEQYTKSKFKTKMNILSLNNGVRDWMLIFPNADVSRAFQTHSTSSRAEAYQMLTNIVLYASEKSSFLGRNQSYVETRKPSVTIEKTIKLARLKYDGNSWNPEPASWRHAAVTLRNNDKIDLQVFAGRIDAGIPADAQLAHLTGCAAIKFSEPEAREIKKYVDAGGTLLIDSAGGNTEFAQSVSAELCRIFSVKESDMVTAGEKLSNLVPSELAANSQLYRPFSRRNIGNMKSPRFRAVEINGRSAVIFTPDDLSVGLVGQPIDGITGFTPTAARAIVRNLIGRLK